MSGSGSWKVGILIAAVAAGCAKPPPEAPKELGDLGLFLFKHFEDEDPAEMAVGLQNLKSQIKSTDFTADPKDIAVTMPILQGDDLGGLEIPAGISADAQIPIALAGQSVHAIGKQDVLALEPNQVCIESESTVWAHREFLSDTGCFEDGSCDRLEVKQEVRKENFLAKVWFDQYKNYRWFELEDEDGNVTRALVGRSWIDQQFMADGGNNSWDQLFHIDAYIEDGGKTLRWFSMWSSVTLGGVGDDLYGSLVIDGIGEALVFGDEFIAGNVETCKNDRNAEKPARE
ncbi:MAG: hypothetical protein R3F59_13620 [Myxococcota bacterium]